MMNFLFKGYGRSKKIRLRGDLGGIGTHVWCSLEAYIVLFFKKVKDFFQLFLFFRKLYRFQGVIIQDE